MRRLMAVMVVVVALLTAGAVMPVAGPVGAAWADGGAGGD